MELKLSKYLTGEVKTVKRSTVHFADYNPRTMGEEEYKSLKRSIKKFGLVGHLILNKRTNTIVQGHQSVRVLDELQKYDPKTKKNDYLLRFEVVDMDVKTEKAFNVILNNRNLQGEYDYDKLGEIFADVDYKDAGFTDADMSAMGLDYLFKTEEEENLADALSDLTKEAEEEDQAVREENKAKRDMERAAKVAHMKQVKEEVKKAAQKSADDMDSYIVLSFDNVEHKNTFMQRFGYSTSDKFIKGEDFDMRCEVADMEE